MNAPREIVTDASQRVLTLRWDDGREQRLPHAQLRRACACAECRRLRLDGREVPAAPDISLLDVQLMGYGVQLVFSDGHARGIYPWRYLAQMDAPG
ncbi:DUF971 domain-containing protein [Paraburkholderia sp. DHOC27]|uniref:DUF971 domain-containing protein n=1 Tax=Paraburkholderia sp. DHOC27 TaxID=2303330 RepID=UPI000E3E7D73|nr:DUF971 domain-containing protein [Paraburkholderia sp. DHOC27]RFU45072.1 DUF971 domain-containing protein [Paraburkholderia sp. DHOC27]